MTGFLPCRTCGKYVSEEKAKARSFCSLDCAWTYSVCLNCGKYFRKGRGFDDEHCSRECTVRYVILRKYGPQPVTIVAEV